LIGAFVVWTMSANPGDAGGADRDTSVVKFDAITEPTIEVTSPNGGEVWTAGSSHDIIWRSQAWMIHYATLLYSTDSGTTYSDTIVANAPDPHDPGDPETTSYTWTVPSLTSSTVRVKAEARDEDDLLLDWDESDADFTITLPGEVPDIDLSAMSHDYGGVMLGDSSDWTLCINNRGTADLTVSDVGCDNGDFAVVSPSFPQTVALGDSLGALVRFKPSASDGITCTLTVTSDDPDESNLNVFLEGRGVQVSVPSDEVNEFPTEFTLSQNYPNPFNPITDISYVLPKDCHVRLDIHNILGQKVTTLVDGKQKAGYKTVRWDASTLSSGIYFSRLQAGDFEQTRKMVLIR